VETAPERVRPKSWETEDLEPGCGGSCKNTCNVLHPGTSSALGNSIVFKEVIYSLHLKFGLYGSNVQDAIKAFFVNFLPEDASELNVFCADTSTSALEGFHFHHHQDIPKSRSYIKYQERVFQHDLLWNENRLAAALEDNDPPPPPSSSAHVGDLLQKWECPSP